MEKKKALLDVVEESVRYESDENEEKVTTPSVLRDMPEDTPSGSVVRFLEAIPQSAAMAEEKEEKCS